MAPHPSPSVDSLRHRSEQSRAELKKTIGQLGEALSDTTDELKTTFSADHLKDEVRAYARRKQTNVVDALKRNVSDHPLQALAIGAAVAYPLLGIFRKVPIPLALIGAGLLLSRNRTSSNGHGAAPEEGQPENMGAATAEEGFADKLQSGIADVKGSVAAAGAKATDTISGLATSTVSRVQSATQDISARAGKASEQSRDAIVGLVDRNPLLVGGVAVAIGGFIAASIPASRLEDSVFGKGSDAVKATVGKAAEEAIKGAKAEAAGFADNISAAARDEGLTPEALDETVDAVTEKVASVVDRGVDAAIGANPREHEIEDIGNGDQNAKF
jgi:ElaB/YqjD/DUF883 family membrane-anchored ribosome-binding protein